MARTNAEVAAALHEIAELLEIRGDDRFRVMGYRRAAESIESLTRNACDMSVSELVASVRGVGRGMADKVVEFCTTGKMAMLEELRVEFPPGVREMTRVPGLGPKRAMQLYRDLGIASIDDLREAAESHRLSSVRGIGPKFEEQVLAAIARGVRSTERILLARALPMAEEIVAQLVSADAISHAAYAGSVRRMKETIGDLDILLVSNRPDEAMEIAEPLVGARRLQIDVRVVELEAFGAAWQYFTGSESHNVKCRQLAVRNGYKLSEYGLFDAKTEERLAGASEEEVYERLGMQWIPPTMREDKGEVEAALAGELPHVVELSDLRGDLQSHTTYSDGRLSVAAMAEAAADRGYEYYAVTDHGPRLAYMRHLTPNDIVEQRREVDEANERLKGRITVLHGIELNVAADGSLDYPDDVLASFDLCVASIHGQFNLSKPAQTKRLIRAIENPRVHVVGHPSGRRLDRREGIDFDVGEVAKAAARHQVALEINAHPWRLDLRDDHIRWARDAAPDVMFVISTDAHSIAELDNMHYGVATAQRGWTVPDEVINTWPLDRLRDFLAKKG